LLVQVIPRSFLPALYPALHSSRTLLRCGGRSNGFEHPGLCAIVAP
jgi:hypothetical protein